MLTRNRSHARSRGSSLRLRPMRHHGPLRSLAHQEDRHVGVAKYLFRDRPEEQPAQSAASMRAHGDEIGAAVPRGGNDFVLGPADSAGRGRVYSARAKTDRQRREIFFGVETATPEI